MGMAAVVIDLGNARQLDRQAQNAVDAASLAAVVDYDGTAITEAPATARAIEYVEDNGFVVAQTTIATAFTTNAAGEPCVTVDIANHQVPTFFGPILGANQLSIGAISSACRTPDTVSLPGVFAGGSDCIGTGKAFSVSGNDNRMEGSIHSNYDAKEAGNSNVRSSGTTATYRSAPLDISGSSPNWWTGATQVGLQPWPLTFTLSEFDTGGVYANAAGAFYTRTAGDRDFIGPVPAGLYYVDGKVKMTNVTITPRTIGSVTRTGATFVSTRLMELDGSNSLIRPFEDAPSRLVFFAGWQEKAGGERCDSETFKISGNCNRFDGLAYVPSGKFRVSGEGNGHDWAGGSCGTSPTNTFSGGVIAYAAEISGNWSLLRGGNVPTGSGSPYLSD